MRTCEKCEGMGWTVEHDPSDPHEFGCTNCPIQVQCEECEATGVVPPFHGEPGPDNSDVPSVSEQNDLNQKINKKLKKE